MKLKIRDALQCSVQGHHKYMPKSEIKIKSSNSRNCSS